MPVCDLHSLEPHVAADASLALRDESACAQGSLNGAMVAPDLDAGSPGALATSGVGATLAQERLVDWLQAPLQDTARTFGIHDRGEILLAIREAIVRVGWTETARRSGIDRVTLHRAFGTTPRVKGRRGPVGPLFDTVLAVLPAIGLELSLKCVCSSPCRS